MIAWCRLLLFECHLMLLVNDDKAKAVEGQEDAGTHSDDDVIRTVGELTAPHVLALTVAVFAVVYAETVAEDAAQAVCELCGEHNLRQQVQHLFTLSDGLRYQMNVYLGLAA